jgi:hypothetical protein
MAAPKMTEADVPSSTRKSLVPGIEIESPSREYGLVTHTILEYIGCSFGEWVNRYYNQRMSQILSDYKEFGAVLRESVRRSHGIFDD